MAIDYAWEKLYLAARTLATADASIQWRVASAYVHYLHGLTWAAPDAIPPDLRAEFDSICDALRKIPPLEGYGIIPNANSHLTPEEASSLAERIMSIYDAVTRLYGIEEFKHGRDFRRKPLPPPASSN